MPILAFLCGNIDKSCQSGNFARLPQSAGTVLGFKRNHLPIRHNMDYQSEAKQYTVSVRTNDIHEAIAKTGTALAALVDEALLSHEPHEIDEECEFEEFARELLRVLTSHSDELAPVEDAYNADIPLS